MLVPKAERCLLAIALFLVCCWVNPNDAVPYRTRPQLQEQGDHRVGYTDETSALKFAHREIGQLDLGADRKPALSGGGKRWRFLQPPRSHRSRMKNSNMNVNINRNHMGRINRPINRLPRINQDRISRLSKIGQLFTPMPMNNDMVKRVDKHKEPRQNVEPTTTETVNCSQPHKEDDRYSSSFNVNTSLIDLNVSAEFRLAGEEGPKQTSSTHVGEDITLCWIETTTIKEDHSVSPIQRLVIREYTISFENSATIPDRYLECTLLEGEVNGTNITSPTSALFEIIDENTYHSRVVNFTTVSRDDNLTIWRHKRVRCGVGPVVTKNIIEWPDDKSNNSKKRVEIKVSPKIQKLTAHPTEIEPCTTELIDTEQNFTTLSSSEHECLDGNCESSTSRPDADSESSILQDEITPSYPTTLDVDEETTDTMDDRGSDELSSTPTTDMINSSEEVRTTGSATTGETAMTVSDLETSGVTESSTVLSVTLDEESGTSLESDNQEVESSEETETEEYCEDGESCTEFSSEGVTDSWEDWSTDEFDIFDTTTPSDRLTAGIEETLVTEPQSSVTMTELIEGGSTIRDITESSLATIEMTEASTTMSHTTGSDMETTKSSDITISNTQTTATTTNENRTDLTESVFRSTTAPITMTTLMKDTTTSLEGLTNSTSPDTETTTGFDSTIVSTTGASTTEVGHTDEGKTKETLSTLSTNDESDRPEGTTTTPTRKDVTTTDKPMTTTYYNYTTVLGGSSEEGCDSKNGTTTCVPTSVGPSEITETVDMNATDVTEMTTTTVTGTGLPTTSDLSNTTRGEETTTENSSMVSCETDESCELDNENENINIVDSVESSEECESANETVTCQPTSIRPGETTSTAEMNNTDITEITWTATTGSDLSITSDEATTSSVKLDGETTVEETTAGNLSTLPSEESSIEDCDTENGTVSCRPTSGRPESTTEMVDMNKTDVTDITMPMTMTMTTGTDLSTSNNGIIDGSTVLSSGMTTEQTTIDLTGTNNETTRVEKITDISYATTEAMSSWSTSVGDNTTYVVTGGVSEGTEVTLLWTTLGGDKSTEVSTVNINDSTTESTTSVTESIVTSSSDENIDVTASSTTGVDQSESIDFSTDGIAQTSTDLSGSTMSIGDVTTETISNATDGDVLSITAEKSDLQTVTETISGSHSTDDLKSTPESTTSRSTKTVFSTTDANVTTQTNAGDGSTVTIAETVTFTANQETTSNYSTVSSIEDGVTTAEPETVTKSCNTSSGDCDTAGTVDVTPTTSQPCDPESGNCSTDSTSSTSSTTPSCDEESGNCTTDSSTVSTTVCDEDSNGSCTSTSESQESSTSIDISEKCDNGTGNCATQTATLPDTTDLPLTTSSTPVEVGNISTTVIGVPTTVDNRESTTETAVSSTPKSKHKLALTIKILLEHIDENQNRQQLYEIEKHLLFDEHPGDNDNQSLMKQVRSLNNTVSMQTVQALFNCSTVEKLTNDVGDFTAKYAEMQKKLRRIHASSSNSSNLEGLHLHKSRNSSHLTKREVDPNLKMSLPGIHADIHSGLSHVMSRVQFENEVEQRGEGVNEGDNPPSRILEVVTDSQDKRVHARRKRQTMEDLMIDQQDLPRDVEKVGRWSNERVRRAINGGHIRTLTEFTIYEGP